MRVLSISLVTWPTRGGLSTVVHELQSAALRMGDQNILVGPVGSRGEEGEDDHALRVCLPEITTSFWDVDTWRGRLLRARARLVLQNIVRRENIDLIHVHFPSDGLSPVLAVNVPLVITYHGSDVMRVQDAMHRRSLARMNAKAEALVVVSEFLRQELESHLPHLASRIQCIRNGRPKELRKKRKKATRGPVRILFVGDLIDVKGVDLIPAALVALRKRTEFVFTATGEGHRREWLTQELMKSISASNLRILGEVGPDRVAQEMSNAEILVLPSRREGLPNVLLEAMAHGCVVVASAAGGIPEIVEHGTNGILIEPGKVSTLEKGIQQVIDSVELQDELRENAYEFLTSYPDWDQTYHTYRELYSRIIEHQ